MVCMLAAGLKTPRIKSDQRHELPEMARRPERKNEKIKKVAHRASYGAPGSQNNPQNPNFSNVVDVMMGFFRGLLLFDVMVHGLSEHKQKCARTKLH